MAEKVKTKRVSVSKTKLAETASGLEMAAAVTGLDGALQVADGAQQLEAAQEVADLGAVELAAGASNLTRAVDAGIVAERMARLSETVAVAGVVDVAEGADMLAASDDVNVMSALVGLMSLEDAEHGLELARLAGELSAIGQVVEGLQMPLLTVFLAARSVRLQEMAVEQIRQAGSTRSLAHAMAATGQKIADMGENEVAEGMVRMAVSQGMAERSAELAFGSEVLAEQSAQELATAVAARQVAKELREAGVDDMAAGSAELGAAVATGEFAEALNKKAEG